MSAAGRVSAVAPFGSLLKGAEKPKRGHGFKPGNKLGKRDTPPGKSGHGLADRDPRHLALVRRLPCLACDNDPAGVAAHVRMTRAGKPLAGTGNKPGDHWTLPLCPGCHTDAPHAQHRKGEVRFWADLGLDPLVICQRVYAAAPDVEAMRAVIFAERAKRR